MTHKKITDPRLTHILKHTDISKKGIEIAPYHSPILPKAEGYDVCILDVFDTDTLRSHALKEPVINKEKVKMIEDVDFVGDACNLGAIISESGQAGQFSYVISSHNFEHLANPIKFLKGVSVALQVGGVLSMEIPDCRCSFDTLRLPTRLSDWLVAYHMDKAQPSPADIFDFESGYAEMEGGGAYNVGAGDTKPPIPYTRNKKLRMHYHELCEQIKDPGSYRDAHCNIVFPELLELYLHDLRHLDLIDLELIEPLKCNGSKFFAYLKKIENPVPKTDEEYCELRQVLLRRIRDKVGSGAFRSEEIELVTPLNKIDEIYVQIERMNAIIRRIERRGILAFFQRKNRKRLARRRAKIDSENKHRQ